MMREVYTTFSTVGFRVSEDPAGVIWCSYILFWGVWDTEFMMLVSQYQISWGGAF